MKIEILSKPIKVKGKFRGKSIIPVNGRTAKAIPTGRIASSLNRWYHGTMLLPPRRYLKIASETFLREDGLVITCIDFFDNERFKLLPKGTKFTITT